MYQGQQELIVLLLQNKTILTSVRFAVNNPSSSGTEQGAGEGKRGQERKGGWKNGAVRKRSSWGRDLVEFTHFSVPYPVRSLPGEDSMERSSRVKGTLCVSQTHNTTAALPSEAGSLHPWCGGVRRVRPEGVRWHSRCPSLSTVTQHSRAWSGILIGMTEVYDSD